MMSVVVTWIEGASEVTAVQHDGRPKAALLPHSLEKSSNSASTPGPQLPASGAGVGTRLINVLGCSLGAGESLRNARRPGTVGYVTGDAHW